MNMQKPGMVIQSKISLKNAPQPLVNQALRALRAIHYPYNKIRITRKGKKSLNQINLGFRLNFSLRK